MKRVASQLTFCTPDKTMRRAVIELDDQNTVNQLFCLDEHPVESAHTLFYDGIISSEIISVKMTLTNPEEVKKNYLYVDVSDELPGRIPASEKPLLLDFGTNGIETINKKAAQLSGLLHAFSLNEIIAACCYYPALATGQSAGLQCGKQTKLVLWGGTDLVNRKFTERTQLKELV